MGVGTGAEEAHSRSGCPMMGEKRHDFQEEKNTHIVRSRRVRDGADDGFGSRSGSERDP